jgi:thymidine kinase
MSGSLEVIVGSMFSGKSEELIRRAKRSLIARRPVQVFKPAVDDRFGAEIVRSHDGDSFVAIPVRTSADLRSRIGPDTAVVAIDEVQFFDAGIVDVCRQLVADGRRVVCAGLDLDFRGEPFGPVPALLALAERVDKLQAICVRCGEPGTRTQRIVDGVPADYDEPIIVIGAQEAYEARCRACHEVPRKVLVR